MLILFTFRLIVYRSSCHQIDVSRSFSTPLSDLQKIRYYRKFCTTQIHGGRVKQATRGFQTGDQLLLLTMQINREIDICTALLITRWCPVSQLIWEKLLTESCQSLFCPLCVFSLHFNLHPALLLNVCNGAVQILARKNILIQINLTIFLDTHITLKDTSVMEAQYLAV